MQSAMVFSNSGCAGVSLRSQRQVSAWNVHTAAPSGNPKPWEAPVRARQSVIVEMGRRADKVAARKGKGDAKKAKANGLIGKKIVQTVKQGGSDPSVNSRLADVLKQAKVLGVPKDVVDRNLKRATDKNQADFAEICYEAYGPSGTGFIIECLTDNVNRTAHEVKNAINKSGCKVAEPGSVMFMFSRAGQVVVEGSEEAVFEAAMEAGAEDIVPVPEDEESPAATPSFRLLTAADEFSSTASAMEAQGFAMKVEESGLIYKANAEVEVDDDAFAICEALTDRLLELDDVDSVYTNCEGLEL